MSGSHISYVTVRSIVTVIVRSANVSCLCNLRTLGVNIRNYSMGVFYLEVLGRTEH